MGVYYLRQRFPEIMSALECGVWKYGKQVTKDRPLKPDLSLDATEIAGKVELIRRGVHDETYDESWRDRIDRIAGIEDLVGWRNDPPARMIDKDDADIVIDSGQDLNLVIGNVLNVAGLTVFANDGAAGVGGLVTGDLYILTATQALTVKT